MPKLLLPIVFIILWTLFWIGDVIAPVVAIVRSILTWNPRPISNAFVSANRLAATVWGFDGKKTQSHECGLQIQSGSPCRFCRIMCPIVGFLLGDKDHCINESK